MRKILYFANINDNLASYRHTLGPGVVQSVDLREILKLIVQMQNMNAPPKSRRNAKSKLLLILTSRRSFADELTFFTAMATVPVAIDCLRPTFVAALS